MKTPKPRTTRPSHLPQLNPLELSAVVARIAASPMISSAGKRAITESLRAAANPEGETPQAAIRTLDKEEQKAIKAAQAGYKRVLSAPEARGKAALMSLSDDEWQRLVNESESD